jgi:hypothetical protein
MAAGITGRLMDMSDVVALIDASKPLPAKPGPYKKRASVDYRGAKA